MSSYSLARILLPKCSVWTCLWNSEWGGNLMEESMCLPFDCSRRRSYGRILACLYSRYRSTYHVSFMGRLVLCLVDVWDLHWKRQANSPAQISSPGTITSFVTYLNRRWLMLLKRVCYIFWWLNRTLLATHVWCIVSSISVLFVKHTGRWRTVFRITLWCQWLWLTRHRFKRWVPLTTDTTMTLSLYHTTALTSWCGLCSAKNPRSCFVWTWRCMI